ncbi:hypothetical protein P43SY_000113 [Pythium insidiosum]|uniref:Uncharacterized protein n=1 Tax=Pythium insidiosum TaxID=114742 RepID=A0AAD5LK43_PYTIN|nr:hypothetical protein P43SY_000113 [Pythium insidiosum]
MSSRAKTKPKPVRKKSALERERAAERARDDSLLYNLTLDVNELRQQLHDLHTLRQALETRARFARRHTLKRGLPFASSAFAEDPLGARGILGTAHDYLRVMHHGLRPGDRDPVEFITARTADMLSLGVTGLGRDALVGQWERYTAYFDVDAFALRSATLVVRDSSSTKDDDGTTSSDQQGVVRCAVQLCGRFTARGLAAVFPAAWQDPTLRTQLLGRRLECELLFHLYFDSDGRIVRHDVETDFLGALQYALDGNSRVAAQIMEQAVIGEEAMVAPLDEELLASTATTIAGTPASEPEVWRPKRVRHTIASLCPEREEDDVGPSPMSSPHACEELYDADGVDGVDGVDPLVEDDPRLAVTFLLS